jgi:hypothetical protein
MDKPIRLTIEKIQETETYQSMSQFEKNLTNKASNKNIIENALNVYRTNGYINPSIGRKYGEIVKELWNKEFYNE